MFHRRGDDMAAGAPLGFRPTEHGEVVGFGPAGGKNQLFRPAADQTGYLLPGGVQFSFRRRAEGMEGGGVAVAGGHHFHRFFRGLQTNRGGGAVVEISDSQKNFLPFLQSALPVKQATPALLYR